MTKLLIFTFVALLSFGRMCGKQTQRPDDVKEITFAGGQLKDGRITVNPDVKVEQNSQTKKIILRRNNGTGVEVDCSCILEAGGECWPVTQGGDGHGPVIVLCASTGCGTGDEPFCLTEITEANVFSIKANIKSIRGVKP